MISTKERREQCAELNKVSLGIEPSPALRLSSWNDALLRREFLNSGSLFFRYFFSSFDYYFIRVFLSKYLARVFLGFCCGLWWWLWSGFLFHFLVQRCRFNFRFSPGHRSASFFLFLEVFFLEFFRRFYLTNSLSFAFRFSVFPLRFCLCYNLHNLHFFLVCLFVCLFFPLFELFVC